MEIINRGSRRILPIRRFVFAVFAFTLVLFVLFLLALR